MATVIEVKYFNSFWLKTVNDVGAAPVFPNGYPYNTGRAIVRGLGLFQNLRADICVVGIFGIPIQSLAAIR